MERPEELVHFLTRLEVARRERQELSRRVTEATGVTFNQVLVLSEVEYEKGQATVTTLAERLARAVHTLTAAINGLDRKGLVVRTTPAGSDRRFVRIAITSEGAEVLAQFRKSIADILAAVDPKRLDREPPEEVRQSSQAVVRLLGGPE